MRRTPLSSERPRPNDSIPPDAPQHRHSRVGRWTGCAAGIGLSSLLFAAAGVISGCERESTVPDEPGANSDPAAAESVGGSGSASDSGAQSAQAEIPRPVASPRPGSVVVAGQWRHPAQSLDRALGWAEVSLDWRQIAQSQLAEMYAAVDLEAPVVAAFAIESLDGGGRREISGFSFGLSSWAAADKYLRSKQWPVRTLAPHRHEFSPRESLVCRTAPGLGPARLRASCAMGPDARMQLDTLEPYLVSGEFVTREGAPGLDLQVYPTPLRRAFAAEIQGARANGGPLITAFTSSIPHARLRDAAAEAAMGLYDEAWALVDEIAGASAHLTFEDQRGVVLGGRWTLRPSPAPSYSARLLSEMASQPEVAPVSFWRGPAHAISAAWSNPVPVELLSAVLQPTSELTAAGMESIGLPKKQAQKLQTAIDGLAATQAQALRYDFQQSQAEADMLASVRALETRAPNLGKTLRALQGVLGTAYGHATGQRESEHFVREMLALATNAKFRTKILGLDESGHLANAWPKVRTRAAASKHGLPRGSRFIYATWPKSAQKRAIRASASHAAKSGNIKLRDVQLIVLQLPGSQHRWYLSGVDESELVVRARSLLAVDSPPETEAAGGAKTLAMRTDLGHLREFAAWSAGFSSVRVVLATMGQSLSAAEPGAALIRDMVHGLAKSGRDPLVFGSLHAETQDETVSGRVELLVPAKSLRDLVAVSPLVQPNAPAKSQ